MSDKVLICDFRVTGYEHLMINLAIIEGFVANSRSVVFAASASHVIALKKYCNYGNVEFISMSETYFSNRWKTFFYREVLFLFKYLYCLMYGRRHNCTAFLITTTSPIQHFVRSLVNVFFRVRTKIILHAELESLVKPWSVSRVFMVAWLIVCKFSGSDKYVVLSEHIKSRLVSDFGLNAKKIEVKFHPFPSCFVGRYPIKVRSSDKINLGVAGLMRNDNKGLDLVYDMIDYFSNLKIDNMLCVGLIGRAASGFRLRKGYSLNAPFLSYDKPVPQEEFDLAVSKLDFLILPYPAESYRLTASGAVFDALKLNIPLLAMRNDLFDSMEKMGVFPGRLFSSKSEMFSYVEGMFEAEGDLNAFLCALRRLREVSFPEAII